MTDSGSGASSVLAPEDAFSVLGDEARLEILDALGSAQTPLAYSELFRRIDYEDISNFSYHLDQLVGHFVDKSDQGYALRRPGERILEAVRSGAVTNDPVRERTQTDRPCPFCSAPIEVGYEQERVTMHCPECPGLIGRTEFDDGRFTESGNLGFRPLPPAAVHGRSTAEIHDASKTWTALTVHAIARGICPRCSGAIEHSAGVCTLHDASDGPCEECGKRYGVAATATCKNCIFDIQVGVAAYLGTQTEVMSFFTDHGIDPLALEEFHPYTATESIVSHEPFRATYTYTIDEDTLTVTIDGELSVVDVERRG